MIAPAKHMPSLLFWNLTIQVLLFGSTWDMQYQQESVMKNSDSPLTWIRFGFSLRFYDHLVTIRKKAEYKTYLKDDRVFLPSSLPRYLGTLSEVHRDLGSRSGNSPDSLADTLAWRRDSPHPHQHLSQRLVIWQSKSWTIPHNLYVSDFDFDNSLISGAHDFASSKNALAPRSLIWFSTMCRWSGSVFIHDVRRLFTRSSRVN